MKRKPNALLDHIGHNNHHNLAESILTTVQLAIFHESERRRERCFKSGKTFMDDEGSTTVYVPQNDDEGGFKIFILAEHQFGPKNKGERFQGIPPKGALILDIRTQE